MGDSSTVVINWLFCNTIIDKMGDSSTVVINWLFCNIIRDKMGTVVQV